MAGTLHPDKELQRFNQAKENASIYFRFKPRSAAFNIVFMGLIPFGLAYYAYANEGTSFYRKFRKEPILNKEYVPRT